MPWKPKKTWDCLCNGSRYDHIGNIITDPTVKRLSRYKFEQNNGKINILKDIYFTLQKEISIIKYVKKKGQNIWVILYEKKKEKIVKILHRL